MFTISFPLSYGKTKRFVHQLTLPLGFTGCGFFMLGKSYLIAVRYRSCNPTILH